MESTKRAGDTKSTSGVPLGLMTVGGRAVGQVQTLAWHAPLMGKAEGLRTPPPSAEMGVFTVTTSVEFKLTRVNISYKIPDVPKQRADRKWRRAQRGCRP